MNGWRSRNRLARQKYATSCAAASPARSLSLAASRYQSQSSFHANPYAALMESWKEKLSIPDVISELALERREKKHPSFRCWCTPQGTGAAPRGRARGLWAEDAGGPTFFAQTRRNS